MSAREEKRTIFVEEIWDHYKKEGRHSLPWRHTENPYYIVVSEVMLQQTQVSRVLVKYPEFLKHFPDWEALASATPLDVVSVWQGMGYNRRALSLRLTAQKVVEEYGGVLPDDPVLLETFPGVGKATASSIAAFAFNSPTLFIETNIRRVYLHFFFPRGKEVPDTKIIPILKKTVPNDRAREWYWALMDYGTKLARELPNANRRSAHYKKQSVFQGSNRQARGAILKYLVTHRCLPVGRIAKQLNMSQEMVEKNLDQLQKEGFLEHKDKSYYVKE